MWGLSTWQIFGAITAVAKILRLDGQQIRHAFGLGGVSAPVPYIRKFGHAETERPYSWAKNNYGWASMGAVVACLLARRGFVGNRCILDGEHGFWVMAGSDRCDFQAMTAGLGEEYLLPKTGFKPYACCRLAHTTLDAVGSIRARGPINPAQIVRVDIHTFSEVVENLGGPQPTSIIDAQFHLPYLVALELLDRSPRRGLTEADLADPAVLGLMRKVTLHLDREADRGFFEQGLSPAHVVVALSDERRLEASAEVPTGSPGGLPFTSEDLAEKFQTLVTPVIGPTQARELEAIILELDGRNAADLVRHTVPASERLRTRSG